MTDHDNQPIRPAEFKPQTALPANDAEREVQARPPWLIPAIVGLVTLVIFVFLLLPVLVQDSESTPATTPSSSTAPGQGQSAPTQIASNTGQTAADAADSTAPSPFAEAQLQKQRRAAQEALQRVLELQEVLQELSVETWASEAYAAAVAKAEIGDGFYRERDFVPAAAAYLDAGDALLAIEASIAERANEAAAAIEEACEVGDAPLAENSLALMQLITPGDSRLPALEARTRAIAEVQAALAQAAEAAESADFSAAVAATEGAVAADAQHKYAREQLASYRQQLADARFLDAMSKGYFALEEARFDDAAAAFSRAAKIRPGAPEPQAAQLELSNARTAANLRQKQQLGLSQEQAEDWSAAVDTYTAALAIDPSVAFARDGLARAKPRKELAETLSSVIEHPERLVDARALAEAQEHLTAARTIADKGPVLDEQITSLERLLEYAQTPVSVELTSDMATDITVLRVKRLGTFSTTTLTLRPGQYTAMGVRNGYRDVRINFEVKPGESRVIDVRCTETI